ncbi:tetratricopeptide repeat protein [Sphingomonas cavernae]|uniref:Tetratricopeptide repeat protein n=1 Tax=Sphingomonas cavernae TaxID=2320861 RepID=A0A418W7C3_9SPHN|nr:tetratricopeptide repeat protein [Sphingomonas cavernae]RJF85935.1 tetratricopeptide repeat protein [Sphingomonas cavernae]
MRGMWTAGRIVLAAALAWSGSAVIAAGGGGGGGSMPSASAPSYDPAEDYRKGIEALGAKDYKAARKALDRVVRAVPKDANSNYLAGLAHAGEGDVKRARGLFEKAVKYNADLVPAQGELGVAHAKLGDQAKAQAQLDMLKQKQAACGGSCAQAADLQTAVDAVSAAITAGPQARMESTPGAAFMSAAAGDGAYLDAVALINEHRYEDAIAALTASQSAFGPHPDILTYLGFANRKLKRYAMAEDYYRTALAIAPKHRGATEYYGELMVERGDLAGAERKLAQLDAVCDFGCQEAEELRRWIAAARASGS